MTMQNNIDIVRRHVGRNMLQTKLQTFAREIDNQGPIRVPIAIPAHDRERRTDRLQVIGDRRLADIAKVPDFIRAGRQIKNRLWKFVMRISKNEDFHAALARKAPATKLQAPGKLQAPSFKVRLVLIWLLLIGVSLGFGFWDLGFSFHRVL
jgi:hypothetical protein